MDQEGDSPPTQESQVDIFKPSKNYGGTNLEVNNIVNDAVVTTDEMLDEKNTGTAEEFSFFRAPKKQKVLLLSMGFVNFCACTCFSLLAPFYPKEASRKGASETVVGMVFGIFELVIFISAPIFGNYITRIGSRFMFISGVMVCGVCAILFGLLDKSPDGDIFIVMCFLSRIVEALGASAYITASFAILSHAFPNHVATVIGSLETFSGIGLMIGPTIGSALYVAGGYGLPFFVMGSVVIGSGVVCLLAMPKIDDSHSSMSRSILGLLKSPLCVITAIVIVCGAYTLGFLDPTFANHLSPLKLTTIQIGLMFLIAPGMYAISAPVWGWIGDSKKIPKILITLGYVMMTISFLLLGPAPFITFYPFTLWSQIVSLVLLGLFLGCGLIPTFTALFQGAQQIGFEESFVTYGMVSGLFNSCFSLGAFLGPTGGGVLVDVLHFPWASSVCGALSLLAALLMIGYCVVEKYSDCIPQIHVKNGYEKDHNVNETSPLLSSSATNV